MSRERRRVPRGGAERRASGAIDAASDAGRVIAGTARGMRLLNPGPGTRPLGDRVKQTLFAILEPSLAGAAVLDLFAGSGAAGIEALSRGASRVVFVESDPSAATVVEANLARTRLAGPAARVVVADALGWLDAEARTIREADRFRIVLADPPYERTDLLLASLERLGGRAGGELLVPGAHVVAKTFWRDAPPEVVGLLASERTRRFGETALTFYRRREAAAAEM